MHKGYLQTMLPNRLHHLKDRDMPQILKKIKHISDQFVRASYGPGNPQSRGQQESSTQVSIAKGGDP